MDKQAKRVKVLTDILMQLHKGATPESVQADFDEHFNGVSAIEISLMEHELIESDANDITFEDVMQLCNVHANLFKNKVSGPNEISEFEKAGHPIHILKIENQALRAAIMRINRLLKSVEEPSYEKGVMSGLKRQYDLLGQFTNHYQRKEEVFFPVMERYGHDAPPKVMWGVDDQIRDLFAQAESDLANNETVGMDQARASFDAFVHEFNEMVFKEESILVPLVLDIFNEDDWIQIATDSKGYGYAIVKPEEEWIPERVDFEQEARDTAETSPVKNTGKEALQAEETSNNSMDNLPTDKEIPLGNGYLTVNELHKIMDLIPLELTFINRDNVFKYFNDSIPDEEKAFRRASSAIGRQVKNCHPPKSLAMVLKLVEELRVGDKEKESMWFPKKNGQFIYVTYVAVRDDDGSYMGILEYVQDIQPLRELEGMKRGLD